MDEHSYAYEEPEVEINLVDVLWDLFEQWKAILVVALLCAVAIPGVKLLRDNRSHQASLAQAEAVEKQAQLSTAEGMELAYAGLSDADKPAVELLAQQQELVNMQSAYLQSSLLLNTNPTNQRTLVLKYLLQANPGTEVLPLYDAYAAYIRNDASLQELGNVIDANVESATIYELVGTSTPTVPDSNTSELMLTVSIALPEDADADAVGDVVDSLFSDASEQFAQTLGGHSISRMSSSEAYLYNETAVNRKSALISSINSNNAAIKTAVAALNASQKAAFESIAAILATKDAEGGETEEAVAEKAEVADENTSTLAPPTFSAKFAAVGFVMGVALYAIAYVVLVMIRGRIGSGAELSDYTRSRLLGDVYYAEPHNGLSKLFHSKMVSRCRFGSKGSVSTQTNKVVSTMESVCKHASVDDVHLLRLGGSDDNAARIADGIVSALAAKGIQAQVVDITANVDEKVLLPVKNAMYFSSDDVRSSDARKLSALARSYDVTSLGSVYVRGY